MKNLTIDRYFLTKILYPPIGDFRQRWTSMTYRPKDTKEAILHRLKIARGHMQKVLQMVEDGQYCIDVIHQSQAVQSALYEVDSLLLENHLKTCVVDHIKKGEADASIKEIMNVLQKSR